MNKNCEMKGPPDAEPDTHQPASADTALQSGEPRPTKTFASKWLSKLQWEAYYWAPNLLSHLGWGGQGGQDARDQKENEGTRVPEAQSLRSPMIWGVELYGPGEIDTLYDALDTLGWTSVGGASSEHSASRSIRHMRSRGGGAWRNIGHVLRRGSQKPSIMATNFGPLPSEVESLKVGVFQVTASLTAVLVGFKLRGAALVGYETEINADRATRHRRRSRPRAVEWVQPWHQKETAVSSTRDQLRSLVGQWFSSYLPGYFSGLKRPSSFPTMELVTANSSVFKNEDDQTHHSEGWRRLLVDASWDDVWSHQTQPALKFAFVNRTDEDAGLHILASLDSAQYDIAPMDGAIGPGTMWPTSYVHESMGAVLVHRATLEYLKEHLGDLNRTRERMKEARHGSNSTTRTIDEIGQFFDRNIGFPAVARDLARHSKDVHWCKRECGRFTAKSWHDDTIYNLGDTTRKRVLSLSVELTEEEAAIRSHFEQLTNILSVRESIQAQNKMMHLTVVALLVAFCSLLVALPKENVVFRALNDVWSLLFTSGGC